MTQFYVLFASVIGSYIVMQTAGDSMGRDHETYLDAEKAFRMKWKYNATHVEFEVAVKTLGWFSFGLSPDGNMGNSDVALAWVNDATGQAFLQVRLESNGSDEPRFFIIFVRDSLSLLAISYLL